MTTPHTPPELPESLIASAITAARSAQPAYIVGKERDLFSDLWFACNQDMYVFGKRLLESLAATQTAKAAPVEGVSDKCRDLLLEWLEGTYDSADFLRRVKLACGTGLKLAAAPPTVVNGEADKLVWLVELFHSDGVSLRRYHTGFTDLHGNSRSTENPLKAYFYNTEESAKIAAGTLGFTLSGVWRAVQHCFHHAAALPPGRGMVPMDWQPIETAPDDETVVVFYLMKEGDQEEEFYTLDFKEDGGWVHHNDHYEHYCVVAKGGDVGWVGPSEKAPYTHWKRLGTPHGIKEGS